jgi:iron-sulfur cluster assembly protein
MIQITESAAKHLKQMVSQKGSSASTALRLSVEKGGCSGMKYAMNLGEPIPGDQITERDGVVVSVAPESLEFLDGCTVDYTDGLMDAGFRVINPKATGSCGCGKSFAPAEEHSHA